MLDAREVLEQYRGVFVDRDCLFASTNVGVLLTGYVNCEVLFPYFDVMRDITAQLIDPFIDEVQGFVCASTGDITIIKYAMWLANLAYPKREFRDVWADKRSNGTRRIERNGFEDAIQGRRVLVINDRTASGGTTRDLVAESRRLDCEVLGVATIAGATGNTAATWDVPRYHALCDIDVRSFLDTDIPPEYLEWPIACDPPLGHGHEYQKEHRDFPGGYVTLLT